MKVQYTLVAVILSLSINIIGFSAFAQTSSVNGSYVGQIKLKKTQAVLKIGNSRLKCTASKAPVTVGYLTTQEGAAVDVFNIYYQLIYKGKANSNGFVAKNRGDSLSVKLLSNNKAKATVKKKLTLKKGATCVYTYSGELDFYPGFTYIPL
jgi:hypothetical protein